MLEKNIKSLLTAKLIPVSFVLLVYVFWLYDQGPVMALANFIEQFRIVLIMAVGSFVAGGTALGGGAFAFPVMTKVLEIDPTTAKIFSLAIQSFGMTAAALTIIYGGIRYFKNVVWLALSGAIPGVLVSLIFIAENIPRLATKSLFSILLLYLAITLFHLHVGKKLVVETEKWNNYHYIPLAGFLGGIASGLVGSGADIIIFALLVLFYKKDFKAATATSVIIMAVTSVVGTGLNFFYLDVFNREIKNYVLAAIPIVVLGAPLGAYACAKLNTKLLVYFLLFLVSIEISFTLFEISV